jgi:hypothetical protein
LEKAAANVSIVRGTLSEARAKVHNDFAFHKFFQAKETGQCLLSHRRSLWKLWQSKLGYERREGSANESMPVYPVLQWKHNGGNTSTLSGKFGGPMPFF